MKEHEIEEFNVLLRRAESYIRYPRRFGGASVARWRNKGTNWLRNNLPDSELATEFVASGGIDQSSRPLRSSTVSTVQRGLKVLLKAQELLPFLKQNSHSSLPKIENTKKVFIVHGHNDSLKLAAARLVERLELEPIILHEQPNKGRTIIEKFLDHSDVAFALILLTADDKGGLASMPSEKYSPRARQNVILELGYFLGRLGRNRVAAIYQEGVEIPSDYSGVLFIPVDASGIWQLHAAKEMKAAGLKIDLNKI
jgi:predicted nucleotide-binding protein